MSISIEQLISDAKQLANRLKDRELTADSLLNETQSINKKIDEIRQYQEEVDVLNEVARHRPHSQLIAGMQQEHRNLREIQQENRELRAALEDHQAALEHIMSKYRQHTSSLIRKSQIDLTSLHNSKDSQVLNILCPINNNQNFPIIPRNPFPLFESHSLFCKQLIG